MKQNFITYKLLNKLNECYKEEDYLKNELENIIVRLKQLEDDIDMLEMMTMYQSNKIDRNNGTGRYNNFFKKTP